MGLTHKRRVAVLGASDNPERYSNLLIRRLSDRGHEVFPVNPALKTAAGIPAYPRLESLPKGLDVLSVYVNADRSRALGESILASGIPKVVFNPGAENPDLKKRLEAKGVEAVEACSLVLSGMDRL